MLGRNKTVNYAVAGIAIASVALLAYTVTRPTRRTKKGRKRRSGTSAGNKKDKHSVTLEKPIDMHLVMESLEGFNAHVAGDKKNAKLKLPYGARLIRINKKNVDGLTYGEIMDALQKAKSPISLQFRKNEALCAQWKRAEAVKETANAEYKAKEIASAVSKVSAAIELHSTNRVYYSNRILMLLQTKEYEAALRDCQRIRELDPRSSYIKGHYLRGLTLFHLKRYKNAASAFQTVIKLNSGFKKAADRLAECMTKLGEEEKAEKQRRDSQNELLREQFAAKQQKAAEASAEASAEAAEVNAKAEQKEEEQAQANVDAKVEADVDGDVVVVDSEQKKSEAECVEEKPKEEEQAAVVEAEVEVEAVVEPKVEVVEQEQEQAVEAAAEQSNE